jgi:hypothetical protein
VYVPFSRIAILNIELRSRSAVYRCLACEYVSLESSAWSIANGWLVHRFFVRRIYIREWHNRQSSSCPHYRSYSVSSKRLWLSVVIVRWCRPTTNLSHRYLQGVLATVRPGELHCIARIISSWSSTRFWTEYVSIREYTVLFDIDINYVISRGFLRVCLRQLCVFSSLYHKLYSIRYPNWVIFRGQVQWMFITGLSIGLAVDFLVAFAVSFYLLKGQGSRFPSWVTECMLPSDLLTILAHGTLSTLSFGIP